MAPECTENTKNATTKSDVWSYGIVMWEILSFPFGVHLLSNTNVDVYFSEHNEILE